MDGGIPLPDEVLAHIFSFLDPKDKLIATSVCHHWMEVFNEYSCLFEDVCISFVAFSLTDVLKIFSNMTRKFCTFEFKYTEIDEACFLFLERFGPQLRRLYFTNCKVLVNVDQLGRKIQTCNSLSILTVLCINVLEIFCHLPALKSLRFQVNGFSESDIVHLKRTIPLSLKELLMAETIPNDPVYNRQFCAGVGDFIYNRLLSLESLDLCGLNFQGGVMDMLLTVKGTSLKRIRVHPNYLTRDSIETFCNHQKGILSLDLSDTVLFYHTNMTPNVTDSTVVSICNSLPFLEELDISRCVAVDESVVMIFKLKHLEMLNLYGCHNIRKTSFMNSLKGLACKNLMFIDLRGTHIDRTTMLLFLPLLPNLVEITLSHSHYLNSDWVERLPRIPGAGMTFVRRSV